MIIGRIDRRNSVRGTASNKFLGKRTVAAADIKPSKTVRKVAPVQESFAGKTAPSAHQPLIGFSVCEKFVCTRH